MITRWGPAQVGLYEFRPSVRSASFVIVADLDTLTLENLNAGLAFAAVPAEFQLSWNSSWGGPDYWYLMGVAFGSSNPDLPYLDHYGGYPYAKGVLTDARIRKAAVAPVPEPGSLLLACGGLLALKALRRRRR